MVVDVIKEEAKCLVLFPAVIQSRVFLHVESFRYVRDSVDLSSFGLYGVIVMPQKATSMPSLSLSTKKVARASFVSENDRHKLNLIRPVKN